MAGYCDFSMSNNAREAYRDGYVPASKIRGVPAQLVKRFCEPAAWHHTSCWYNATDFYDREEVLMTFGLVPDECEVRDPDAIKALAEYKAAKHAAPEILTECTVEWKEWSGSRTYRRMTKCKETGCTVEIKGQTAKITLPYGSAMTKRLSSVVISSPEVSITYGSRWPKNTG